MKPFLFLFLLFPCFCLAQITISLSNPSFEDSRGHSQVPTGWKNCGDTLESPPDIQPGFWGVIQKPLQGFSYMGMVVRERNTCEAIGQKLQRPMTPGTVYTFSMHLAKSPLYLSPKSPTSKDTTNSNTPAVMRVYGGMSMCDRHELLAETVPIDHSDWREHIVLLVPNAAYTHITFVSYFAPPYVQPYNGHLLADHFSSLVPVKLSAVSDEELGALLTCTPRALFDMVAGCDHPAPAAIQSVLSWKPT